MTTANDYRIPGTNTFEFPSVAEFGAVCRDDSKVQLRGDRSWTGEDGAETVRYTQEGSLKPVELAQQVLDQIEREADLAILHREWTPAVAGAFPIVPDFLTGNPECMRRMRHTQDESEPMTVYVCTTSSCGVDHEALTRRGVAVLALAIALSNSRPVQIVTFTALNGGAKGDAVVKVTLGMPVTLSEAAYALTSCAMDRTLAMAICRAYVNGYHGGWAQGISGGSGNSTAHVETCRKMLKAGPQDVIIPPSTMGTAKISTDPVGWVIDRLREFKQQQEEGEH